MSDDLEQRVRDRAYHLWVDAGRPDGDEEKFWHAAVKELEGGPSEPSTPYGEAGGPKTPTLKTSTSPEPSTPYVRD